MSDDRPPLPTDGDDTENSADVELADVLDGYLADIEAGRAVDTERLLAEHPAIASRLRVCLAGLGLVEQHGRALRSGEKQTSATPVPQELGDFRLLREVGRGGMGIVFEAEQISLARRVALKVLPFASMLDPRQLQRFQTEARAAAALRHAHIVPVYAVGSDRGVHFYAMQFIEGQSLAAHLNDLRRQHGRLALDGGQTPTERMRSSASVSGPGRPEMASSPREVVPAARVRELVRLGIQAAEALEHAHQVGIVHRDIKPANLLVDRTGHLWIADFGLALFRIDERLTRTGDVIGTLRYMSPEQARAQRGLVDHRTDVYALGATLYELLTLRPLFDGADAQALLIQLTFQEPVPPRRLNRNISPELEVILLKAVSKNVEERYATAQDLADDLRCVLEDRPIRARPPSLGQRLSRWAWRHRRAMTVAVALLILAVVGLAVSTAFIWHEGLKTKRALQERSAAQLETRGALARERRNAAGYVSMLAGYELAESKMGRVLRLLNECPEEARHWEWHYLKRLCHSDRLTLRGHTGLVKGMSLSLDGRRLVTASGDGTVRLWDVETGQELRTLGTHAGRIADVTFHPNGEEVASADDRGVVTVWRVAGGAPVRTLPNLGAIITALAFADGGRLLVYGSDDGLVRVWVPDRVEPIRTLKLPEGVNSLACSPGARPLVAASSHFGSLRVWDLATGKELIAQKPGRGGFPLTFSPDGRHLALGNVGFIALMEAETGKVVRAHAGHTGAVTDLAFSGDGRWLVSGSQDRTARLWGESNTALRIFRGHDEAVFSVAISRDGKRVFSGGHDGLVKVWDADRNQGPLALTGHRGWVRDVAFGPGAVLATAGNDATVRLWNARQGQQQRLLEGHVGEVLSVSFSPTGDILASGGADRTVRVWDAKTGREVRKLEPGGVVSHTAFSRDGRLLAAAWNVLDGQGWPPGVTVWNLDTGAQVHRFRADAAAWAEVAFTGGVTNGVAFSPDGRLLAWSDVPEQISLRDVATGRERGRCEGMARAQANLTFSPDSKRLAAPGKNVDVRLWNVDPEEGTVGGLQRVLKSHLQLQERAVFSPDGRRIATASRDGTVKLWDPETGWELLSLRPRGAGFLSVAFSPDGQRLAGADLEGTVYVWDGTPWE